MAMPVILHALGPRFGGLGPMLEGFVGAGRTVQFFVSAPSSNGIGQGQRLLASLVEAPERSKARSICEFGPCSLCFIIFQRQN